MGVELNDVKLLLWAKNLGAAFTKTLTLGRQGLLCSRPRLSEALSNFSLNATSQEVDHCFERPSMGPLYADAFLRLLGAQELVSVDRSDFEGATLLHDLNDPFPDAHRGQYDFVFDGGTLEHVFHYPAALRNCLDLVRVGGHFLTVTPANNFFGHGFYQISPELFFRVLSSENGFDLRKMVIFDGSKSDSVFFGVHDPAGTGGRTELVCSRPMLLAALARRLAVRPLLVQPPLQSDYVALWEDHRQRSSQRTAPPTGLLHSIRVALNPYWPHWLITWKRRLNYYRRSGRPNLKNRRYFKRISRDDLFNERGSAAGMGRTQ
jgi:hypothetical protein